MTAPAKQIASMATPSAWTEPHQALGISPMDHLFNRMDGMYMSKWRREFPSEQAVANWRESWSEAFAEEGITFDEIKRGIVECRKRYDWAPSLPEFLKACRPALDYATAYEEAQQQMPKRAAPVERNGELVAEDRWSHPAVYWAAASLGTDLELPYAQMKNRWKMALDRAMANPKGAVPAVRLALPAPAKVSLAPEEAKARLDEIRGQILGCISMPASTKARPISDAAMAERKRIAEAEIELARMAQMRRQA